MLKGLELGLEDIQSGLSDEEPPKPVDRQRLVDFWQQTLPEAQRQEVLEFMSQYRVWFEAGIQTGSQISAEELSKKSDE